MKLSRERGLQLSCGSRKKNSTRRLHESAGTHRRENAVTLCKTILFVDDEPSILEVRRLIFEDMGYSAFTAESGEEALQVLRRNAVDIVVLDYLMPGLNGEETARRIRVLYGNIPIVLSSGCLTLPQRVLEIVDVSVDKGAGPEALLAAVEEQLQPMAAGDAREERAALPEY